MADPTLTSASFPTLSEDEDKSNSGTVTGSNIVTGDPVKIMYGTVEWQGSVGSQVPGSTTTWNASVKCTNSGSARGEQSETVDVTVSNPGGTAPSTVPTNSNITP